MTENLRYHYKSVLSVTSSFSSVTGTIIALLKKRFKPDYFKATAILNDGALLPAILKTQKEYFNSRRPSLFFKIEPKLDNVEFGGRHPFEFDNLMTSPATRMFPNVDYLPKIFFSDINNQSIAIEERRRKFTFSARINLDSEEQGWNVSNYLINVLNFERPAYYNKVRMLHEIPNTIVYYIAKDRGFHLSDYQNTEDFVKYLNSFGLTKFELFTNNSTGKLSIGFYLVKNLLVSFERPNMTVVKKDFVVDKAYIDLQGWCELAVPSMLFALSQNEVDLLELIPTEPMIVGEGSSFASISIFKKVLPRDFENRVMIFNSTVISDANTAVEMIDLKSALNKNIISFIDSNDVVSKGSNVSVELIKDGDVDLTDGLDYVFDREQLAVTLFHADPNSNYELGLYFSFEYNTKLLEFLDSL
jgi:hypothetical protein